ncbi:hypothetical protein L484_024698 [Morus notabilis]|uniref:SANTA domain-containing protein n=2 Tax=Morus notabilis TaxID=981085 RepID=W9R4V3_9ROSA|nr:hypothetical protein L484_024698 [Morus notabilis]
MTISIDGSLNMSRTHQNGFPYEVCVQFLHGFPYNWEEHADLDVSKGTCAAAKSNILLAKSENNSLPSLNDLPVSAVRDYLLSTLGHSDDDLLIQNIYNDMPGTSRNETSESSGVSMDSKPKRKRSASKPKRKRSVKEESWARYIPTAQDRSVGVCTRSMSRRK